MVTQHPPEGAMAKVSFGFSDRQVLIDFLLVLLFSVTVLLSSQVLSLWQESEK